jgi:hypothetical protein
MLIDSKFISVFSRKASNGEKSTGKLVLLWSTN